MVSFRKAFLLLALVVALTSIASAQFQLNPLQCTANAGIPPIARFEGLADEVGQVVINCSGGTPTPIGATIPTVNITIFMTAPVTSRLMSSTALSNGLFATEAVVMVDEPGSPLPNNSGTLSFCSAATQISTGCPLTSAAGDGSSKSYNTAYNNQQGTVTRYNTWQGQYTPVQPNQIAFLGVPIDPPGTTGNRVVRIANVRINARESGYSSSSFVPNDVNMFISVSGTGSLPLTNNVLRVAFVQPAMTFSVTGATLNQCDPPTSPIAITFTERFGTAFEIRRSVGDQNVPGQNYNTESMFYDTTYLSSSMGLADQGTRLLVRFSGIPSGIGLSAPLTVTGTGGLVLTRVVTDSAGAGSYSPASSTSISLSGGAGYMVYEVTSSTAGLIESATISVTVSYPSGFPATLPGLTPPGSPGTVAGFLAPLSTATRASASAPVPRFVEDNQIPSAALTVNPCQTNLLFPFIAQLGTTFDTGIAISNTSQDPYGTAAQSGTCTLYFYNGTANPPASQTSTSIGAGASLAFSLYAGNATQNIQPVRDFTGYMIARCNFQFGHGFAFISDLGLNKWSEGYLALVLDADKYIANPLTRTGVRSETNQH
jgi:hypothetical protein